MIPIDLIVARDVMVCNLLVVVCTLIVIAVRILRLPAKERRQQCCLTFPTTLWCFNAVLFYIYTFFVKPYWDPIPQNDVYYFAWGAGIILHAALNALGIEITRLRIDGH